MNATTRVYRVAWSACRGSRSGVVEVVSEDGRPLDEREVLRRARLVLPLTSARSRPRLSLVVNPAP